MHWIGGGRDEFEFLIEASGLLILGMNGEGADAGNLSRLQGALHRILQQRLSYSLAVPVAIDRKTRQQHDWHRMARQSLGEPFRRFLAGDVADGERVIADDSITHEADIGLSRARLLIRPCKSQEIAVQLLTAAIESFYPVIWPELFNAALCAH